MFETAVHLMLGGDVGNKKYTYTFNYCITNHVTENIGKAPRIAILNLCTC